MPSRGRSSSFHNVNPQQCSGILSDILAESNIYLGGASVGKGLQTAASYYLEERLCRTIKPKHLEAEGAQDLDPGCILLPNEESFYIVDVGVVVSQVYQCEYCSD